MKILVTGASGFVGRNIIPQLLEAGASITILGRNPLALSEAFPRCEAMSYQAFFDGATHYDLFLHLAVANNDSQLSLEELNAVNIDLTVQLAETAKRTGVGRFINFSSIHALDETLMTPYAQSKRESEKRLSAITDLRISTVYLATVYCDHYAGKFAFLNPLPNFISRAIFACLAALKPTVHADRIVRYILSEAKAERVSSVILVDDQDRNPVYGKLRRTLDLTFAVFVSVFFGWALLLIWAAIKLESKGPGIFKQERVGQNGRVFTLYKFRTMASNTKNLPTHEVSHKSITRVGQLLRRTKLDELPQIWNLIRNDMTLVGPRPCLPMQKELIEARAKRHVSSLKPGITGLAQVNQIDMSYPERLANWDARYMALRGLLLDIKILIKTAFGKGTGDKVVDKRIAE